MPFITLSLERSQYLKCSVPVLDIVVLAHGMQDPMLLSQMLGKY
jgi:hypothetical protein